MLTQVEALGKLELVRYQFKDIVEYRRASRYPLLPDAKVALVVGGEAVGCLDLRKIRPQDVVFEGDSVVRVVLPAPELCSFQVKHDQSRVFSTENGFFQDADLVDQGYKYAEKQVRNAALQVRHSGRNPAQRRADSGAHAAHPHRPARGAGPADGDAESGAEAVA